MASYAEYFAGEVYSNDSSRSGKDILFAIWLARRGVQDDEIAIILRNTPYNSNKYLRDSYIDRTIQKARETAAQVSPYSLNTQTPMLPAHTPSNTEITDYDSIRMGSTELLRVYHWGIHSIDAFLAGGIAPKELTLLAARARAGKTTLLCNVAANMVKQGIKVLFVNYEDTLEKLKRRFSGLLGEHRTEGRLVFLDATTSRKTITDIEKPICDSKAEVVIVDYLARVPLRSGGYANDRFGQRDVIYALAQYAKRYNTSIILADHLFVSDDHKDSGYRLWPSDLSEARMYKEMTCDNIIGLKRDRARENTVWVSGMKCKRFDSTLFKSMEVNWQTAEYKNGI